MMKTKRYRYVLAIAASASAVVSAASVVEAQQTRGDAAPPADARSGKTAAAPAVVNLFTTLDLKTCKRLASGPDGGRWGCGGPKGFEIQFSEGDLRQFLSYGAKGRQQRAATQTLGPFNSVFKDASDRTMIQWRGVMRDGRFVPFATIVRYHTDTGDDGTGKRQRSQVLVITKLGPADGTEACHVAHIDAVASKDANALAVRTADETARGFDCAREPAVIGEKSLAPLPRATRI